jgi:DNA polymerase III gamma/tau subunit
MIADAEKVSIDESALREIARSGMGSMRDAQSNFDQVISFSGEKIAVADVSTALGIASTEMLTRVVDAISTRSPKDTLAVVAELVARGQDLRNFCRDLLAIFRDLMVYKVSDGDAGLVESSALGTDKMQEYAAGFTAADLLRFFNSLAETESNLKEVIEPRYFVETGLVKLVEMRRVVAVEELIERLGRLEQTLAGGGFEIESSQNPSPALEEKKTLNSKPAVPETELEAVPDPPAKVELEEPIPPAAVEKADKPAPAVDISFLDTMPIKLAPIDPEALEHVEDNWLDAAYDRKLIASGDDLSRIATASLMAERFVPGAAGHAASVASGTNGAAAAMAKEVTAVYSPPVFAESEETDAPADLADNATEAEIYTYASAHPLTRKTMRIFRAKIVEVVRVPSEK